MSGQRGHRRSFAAGVALTLAARAVLHRALLVKFGRDVAKLNAGDTSGLLGAYAEDFVLHFNDGDHRWAGDWVGRAGMERFLQSFTSAGLQGEIKALATSGPLWRMTMWARFDDHAVGPDGKLLYENQTVLVLRTRWGKVVEQQDFYLDTGRILEFDRKLTELGIAPVPKPA